MGSLWASVVKNLIIRSNFGDWDHGWPKKVRLAQLAKESEMFDCCYSIFG